MKIDEFMEVINQVERFYSKEIPEEQKQVMYKELKNMELVRFKYIIAQHYRTSPYLPKLPDILEINKKLGYSQIKKDKEVKKCEKCKGTGYILYKKIIDNGKGGKIINTYAAICTCRQKRKYEGWKIADEEHRSNYYIPYVEEIKII